MNKGGQQMTLGTIIAIVLGLVVLVFLIYGFSTGWGNLWERITGLGGGDVNVDTIKTSCTLACQQGNQYGFCEQKRDVRWGDEGEGEKLTCNILLHKGIGLDKCPAIECPFDSGEGEWEA